MGAENRALVGDETTSGKLGSPPPPPPPPRRWSSSVTRREIDSFWRKRRLVEEDHFLAAIKAAARLRASRLSEEDYLVFLEENKIEEEGLFTRNDTETENKGTASGTNVHQEIRLGIKDWWTKSKYAYLNQPAVGSTGRLGRGSRRSNYIPNKLWLCNYNYKYSRAGAAAPATVSAPPRAQAQPPPPYLGVGVGVF